MKQNFKDDLSAKRVSNQNTGPLKENCGLDQSEMTVSSATEAKKADKSNSKMGRWTPEEKERFVEGKCSIFISNVTHIYPFSVGNFPVSKIFELDE